MNKKELKKAYYDKWKKKEPAKYLAWLICYIGSFIPIAIGLIQLIGGLNDDKFVTLIICFIILIVLQIIASIIVSEPEKEWKDYLESHKKNNNC